MIKQTTYKTTDFSTRWKLKRIKDIAFINVDTLDDNTSNDYEILYLDISNVESGGKILEYQEMNFEDAPSRARRIVKENNIALSTVRPNLQAIAFIESPPSNLIASTGFAIIQCKRNFHSKFLFFFFYSRYFEDQIVSKAVGVSYPAINSNDVGCFRLVVPPLSEQIAIASYLDEHTTQIDSLITNKRKQIEKLKELRLITITNAVTKGLNPDVELKDSGVDWLDRIPTHWKVKRIKDITKSGKLSVKTGPFGSDLLFDDFVESGIRVYNQRNVLDNDFTAGDYYISESKYSELRTCTLYPGDVVITSRGTIGACAIFPETAELGIMHPCLMRVQVNTNRCIPEFLRLIVGESRYFKEQINIISNATTIEVIYSDNLREMKLALPPMEEQKTIIVELNEKVAGIDSLIDNMDNEISKLSEFKTILIDNAVTGKTKISN